MQGKILQLGPGNHPGKKSSEQNERDTMSLIERLRRKTHVGLFLSFAFDVDSLPYSGHLSVQE